MRVGDIVHLSNNEQIPADILMLHSSDPNGWCLLAPDPLLTLVLDFALPQVCVILTLKTWTEKLT